MRFGFLGIDYRNADLEIRDRISFTDPMKLDFFREAQDCSISQVMILSTCNRSEIYFLFEEEEQFGQMESLYRSFFPETALERYMRRFQDHEAVSYLFRVAAGFESMVFGEDQILGQVKEALEFSRTMGYSKKELNKVTRDAITCAKKIKSRFKISEKPVSVGYLGVKQVREHCEIGEKTALVIGSGDTAGLALKYLSEDQPKQLFLCSRTPAHAARVQERFQGIKIVEYKDRYQVMEQCDLVISATSSPHLVVRKERFCPQKEMIFLDLAAPRDIDPRFQECEKVTLINLDSLRQVSEKNFRERKRLGKEGESLMCEAVSDTVRWLKVSRMDETIQSLQALCTEIAEDSYGYLTRKLSLSGRDEKIMKKVLEASLQRVIREPIQTLKKIDTKEEQIKYQEMIRQLFRI